MIRLLVTWNGGPRGGQFFDLDPTVTMGANATQVSQAVLPQLGNTSGVVLDDSASGSGGTLPALTYLYGANELGDTTSLTGPTFSSFSSRQNVNNFSNNQFLYFFALNGTGLAALTDLARLNTPGAQELAGMSKAQVAALENFDLDETDRLQTILGNSGDNDLAGHLWGDFILGGLGDDDINAGASDDVVQGEGGNDVIAGDEGADTLSAGEQNDLITGGLGNDFISGDADQDSLFGGRGDDLIFGGTAQDLLVGGPGRDVLFGDYGNDSMCGGAGDDTLSGGFGQDSLAGGIGQNSLTGGIGKNRLEGGAGGDSYFVNSTTNKIVELALDSGTDSVFSTVSLTLAQNIENLILTGTGEQNGTGNSGDNVLTGTADMNILDGGAGADTMIGLGGDDSYVVRNIDDSVIEAIGGGIDTTTAFIAHTLANNVERLILAGSDGIDGTGNSLANRITGNTARNFLDGGLGHDTLTGGAGTDRFEFTSVLSAATNVDRITDFQAGELIRLDSAIFTALAAGGLANSRFVNGSVAADPNDFILYDVVTGVLRYDADGSGISSPAVVFALIDHNFALDASFFQIF